MIFFCFAILHLQYHFGISIKQRLVHIEKHLSRYSSSFFLLNSSLSPYHKAKLHPFFFVSVRKRFLPIPEYTDASERVRFSFSQIGINFFFLLSIGLLSPHFYDCCGGIVFLCSRRPHPVLITYVIKIHGLGCNGKCANYKTLE